MPTESNNIIVKDQVSDDGIFIITEKGKNTIYWCLLCNANILSVKNLDVHENGKKHKTRLKKHQKKEAKREKAKQEEEELHTEPKHQQKEAKKEKARQEEEELPTKPKHQQKEVKKEKAQQEEEELPTDRKHQQKEAKKEKAKEEQEKTPLLNIVEDTSHETEISNPDSSMYSRGYHPHNSNAWNDGFPPNPGLPLFLTPDYYRYPPPMHQQWTQSDQNWRFQNNRIPLYCEARVPNYNSGYRNNQGYHSRDQFEPYVFDDSSNRVNDRSFDRRSRWDRVPGNGSHSNAWTNNRNKSSYEQRPHGNDDGCDSSRKASDNFNKEQVKGCNELKSQEQDSNGHKKTTNSENEKDSKRLKVGNKKDGANQGDNSLINKQKCDTANKTKKSDYEKKNGSLSVFTSPKCSSEVNSTKTVEQESGQGEQNKTEQRRPSTEKVSDRIAHLINPSNPKDKAKVHKLVTEFAKSKRKENLVKLNKQTDTSSNEKILEKKQKKNSETSQTPDASPSAENVWKKKETRYETVQEVSNINPFGPGSQTKKRGRRKTSETESGEPPAKRSRKKTSDSISTGERTLLKELAEEKSRNGGSSKHTCSSVECTESCVLESDTSQKASTKVVRKRTRKSKFAVEDVYDPSKVICNRLSDPVEKIAESMPNTKDTSSSNSQEIIPKVPVKQEIDFEGLSMQFHPCLLEAFTFQEAISEQQLAENSTQPTATIAVESLIDLFASGNVRVKKEFDDPFIDVIRTVDPEILNQACEDQMSMVPPSTSPALNHMPRDSDAASETSNGDDTLGYPLMKTSFKNILNEIQSISALEEKVKGDLQEADVKIQQFQALMDEWKTKKIKLQSVEETYRKQRNSLVRTMADLVAQCNFEKTEELSQPTAASPNVTTKAGSDQSNTNSIKTVPPSKPVKSTTNVSDDSDEIAILPVPDKSSSIPVIDLDDLDSDDSQPTSTAEKSTISGFLSDKFSDNGSFPSHGATVNSLQVFEGHLYSCSNDSTARRISLDSKCEVVVYNHPNRNVSQLCVEKVKGETLVFTICSGSKTVSAFLAKDGTLFRTYSLNFAVVSLCKSKGLIYAGLRNGTIVVCNGRDHKELVNISEPIRSIDTTYQGRLNILVTLSIHGNVSIRDADRNGLLIRYVKARGYLPLFMTVCSDSVFLSSAGVMTVLNIESGTYSSKYSFAAAYTCLAVHRDSIFTASFSGLVRCYSKDEEKPVKMYYGAGNTSITCIYVHDGWVFTGNKLGSVSVFKHDPLCEFPCKLGKCDFLFPRLEDLRTHVLLKDDHVFPSPGNQCTWPRCQFTIPLLWDSEAIKLHLTSHLCSQV